MFEPSSNNFMTAAEIYMDHAGLKNLLDDIAEICAQKAEHTRSNWQDEDLARRWNAAERKIAKLRETIEDPLAP